MSCHRTAKAMFLLLVAACLCRVSAGSGGQVRVVGGHQWGFPLMKKMLLAFCRERSVPKRSFAVEKWTDWNVTGRFGGNEGHVLVHYALTEECRWGTVLFDRFLVGQARVVVIVNRRSRASSMTTGQLREMLRGEITGGHKSLTRMKYLGEPTWGSVSSHILRRACMLIGSEYSSPYYPFREDMGYEHRGRTIAKAA